MTQGKAIIFSAPSGAGKTTIVHHLIGVEDLRLSFSVSATSRSKRGHEQDGKDYFFMSSAAFLRKADNGEMLEWQEVYPDQFYGTLKTEIDTIWKSGKNVIFDVDVEGGLNLKKIFGDRALAVFVQPPSIEALSARLSKRSTETPEKISVRIEKAKSEMAFAPKFDLIIINDNLQDALAQSEMKVRDFLSK
jgi:guanylate kinase